LDAGSDAQKREFLPRLACGDLKMAVAVHDFQHSVDPREIEARATPQGDHFVLSGNKSFVPFGVVSDAFLVATRTAGGSNDGISLFIVDRQAQGIGVSPLQTIARDGQGEVALKDVRVDRDRLLGPEGKGSSVLKDLFRRGAVLKCAEMVGGAQWVLEKTVQYAKDRVQFERPIGSFQAIQHKCANMAMSSDGAKFVTHQAAWLQSENLSCEREVAIAKAWVSEAYTRICLDAHQAHGAIGFTNEYDLQLYTRRAKEAEVAFGDTRYHYEALASHMGL
jgi:alkylation response protein AidB-like acyl-CoA dehydrogenase